MLIGKLDQQVILQSLSETNSVGELTQSWTTVGTVWAHVLTERGQEALEAARINARQMIRVQIRYRTDITTKWRVQWGGQNYSVKSIDRSMRRDGYLWFTAECTGAT